MPVPDTSADASTDPLDPLDPHGGPCRTAVSPTLAANETMARRRRAGLPVLPLGFGEAGLPLQPTLLRELAAAAGQGSYGPVAGSAELRGAVAGYWGRRDIPVDPELVISGPGSKALLFGLLLTLGGQVALPCPSWVSYAAQAALAGAEAVFVPTPPGEGGVPSPGLLADAIVRARAAGGHIRAVVVTQPDNPTGRLASAATVRRLCEVAREFDLVIISDEIYRDLLHDPAAAVHSPARYAPERTVLTTALSKSLAAGGWRLGVAALPDGPLGRALHTGLLGVASEIWSSAAAPVQHAAAYAFTEPAELTERIDRSRLLHGAVTRAVADRCAAAGAEVPAPQAAFYAYPDFEPLRERLHALHGIGTGAELSTLLVERYGVGTLPGSAFGEADTSLRLRLATSLLYGDTTERRLTALYSEAPVALPWIADTLDRIGEVLTELTTKHVMTTSARAVA